ncbi:superoxide dismutase [Flavobacterium rakeshii]|uniref:Superoxide dismutase n=1 Tax=Flavobacterium rakeshii TaxID=1038845 RepID=A0A6N8HDZ1_9FLAO|nr:superoxide dismutase [Flavobacterium rakeshii]MUV03826.1 superoxide dismutase [Flavobacterium rakeshii]
MNKFELPTLPYAYNALEPHFDEETMTIHHQRHHQAYVDNLNKAIETNQRLEQIMPQVSKLSPAIRNNGGGHYNHSLFWKILSPSAKTEPTGKLADEINSTFGSLDKLKEEINKAGVTQFGSGWAWLYVKYNGTIAITATANQDNPLMDTQLTDRGLPILGVDVWEHAYYLKYRNKRADYLDAFWSVLDWEAVERNYEEALAKIK